MSDPRPRGPKLTADEKGADMDMNVVESARTERITARLRRCYRELEAIEQEVNCFDEKSSTSDAVEDIIEKADLIRDRCHGFG